MSGRAMSRPLALTRAPGWRASAQHVLIPPTDRHLLGVEVLEQRLRELPGGLQLVAELRERDGAAMALGKLRDARAHVVQHLRVVVQILRDADSAAALAEGGEVGWVEV